MRYVGSSQKRSETGVEGTGLLLHRTIRRSMSQNEPTKPERSGTAAQYQQTFQIPALLTNSTRAVLHAFGDDIHELAARATRETTNRATVDELSDYGVYREQPQVTGLGINYRRHEYDGEVINPLTSEAINRFENEIDVQLGGDNLPVAPDMPVTEFTIRVTSEALRKAAGTQTATFDLEFAADKAENALLDTTRSVNIDRGLYSQLGFSYMHLNLQSVVETAATRHEQSSGTVMSWGGPGDIHPRSPDVLATRIADQILPDEISFLKPYTVVNDEFITIDEETLDSILNGDA